MKFLTTLLFVFNVTATDYLYNPIYQNTGWSGEILGDENNYQKRLYECAHSNYLSRDNFVAHNSALGFISKKNNKQGISFLSKDGKHKFLPWDSIPRDKNKIAFNLGKHTFIGLKVGDEWRFEDYASNHITLKDEFLIPLSEENFTKDQEEALFGETNKSLDILNNSKDAKKIAGFSNSNLLPCLKTAKQNQNKDFITSINLLAKSSSENIKKEFDNELVKLKDTSSIPLNTGSGVVK